MVGNSADIRVRVTDADGKPVANKNVELKYKPLYYGNRGGWYSNLTHPVEQTDSDGYVTFVFGLRDTVDFDNKVIDATDTDFVASFKLTVSATTAEDDLTASTKVRFAAIDVGKVTGIQVKNNGKEYPDALAATTNTSVNGKAIGTTASTTDRTGEAVEYITSQQVTATTTDPVAHAVYFGSTIGSSALVVPTDSESTTEPSEFNEAINFDTGKYSTYAKAIANSPTLWTTAIDPGVASELQYATVNFGKLSLSKYSRFTVQARLVADPAKPNENFVALPLLGMESSIKGEKVSNDFSVQIPLSNTAGKYLLITAAIESKGQVNTDVNEGFTVKSVVGVRKGTESETVGTQSNYKIPGITIKWEKDENVNYDISKALPDNSNLAAALNSLYPSSDPSKKDYTFEYRLPVFPRTGNAIVTVLNSKNEVEAYYAVRTVNASEKDASGKTVYKNQNVIVDNPDYMYKISKEEAENKVGDVETIDNVAKVNSTKSGVTHVIGTIESTDSNIKIDATNKYIYTSVQWNPIPNKGNNGETTTRAAGAALVGQQIVIKAQLVDREGNAVSVKDENIKFLKNDTEITGSTIGDAAIIKKDATTNALGQAELVLSAGKPEEVLGISAESQGSKYNLKYILGKNSTEVVTANYVDLYWVDANIAFEPDANTQEIFGTTYDTPIKDTKDNVDITPIVGEHWRYQVITSGDLADTSPLGGKLDGYNSVVIGGLTVQTVKAVDSQGDVTINADGTADVTSLKAASTRLVNTLTSASIGDNLTFTFKKNGGADLVVAYAGSGTTTLDKKLTLDIKWTEGVPTAKFIIPTSLKADRDTADAIPVYVLVQDANGNPISGREVKLSVLGEGTLSTPATKLTTDNGIADFGVLPAGADYGKTSTLVAEVTGLGTYTSSIKWIKVSELDEFKIEKVAYDYTAKTIKLTFNNNVYVPDGIDVSAVFKKLIKVYYGAGSDKKEQYVDAISVSGKTVTISVPGLVSIDNETPFEVAISTGVNDDITYTLVSEDAQKLSVDNATITFKANSTEPDPQ